MHLAALRLLCIALALVLQLWRLLAALTFAAGCADAWGC